MHDSEPVWIATPSPYETSIHNTLPVFPFYRRTGMRIEPRRHMLFWVNLVLFRAEQRQNFLGGRGGAVERDRGPVWIFSQQVSDM
jgi:hypothetical protein